MNNAEIVADVLAGNRIVNRSEKMDRTVDVMIQNRNKKLKQFESVNTSKNASARGYGQRRNMGD